MSMHFPTRKAGNMPILKFLEGETRENGQFMLPFELNVLQGTHGGLGSNLGFFYGKLLKSIGIAVSYVNASKDMFCKFSFSK